MISCHCPEILTAAPRAAFFLWIRLALIPLSAQTASQATGDLPGPVADSGAATAGKEAKGLEAAAAIAERLPEFVSDPGVIPTRQTITPAGVQCIFNGQPQSVAFGLSSNEVYAVVAGEAGGMAVKLNWRSNRIEQGVRTAFKPGIQGAAFDPPTGDLLFTATTEERTGAGATDVVQLLRLSHGSVEVLAGHLGEDRVGGVAFPATPTSGRSFKNARYAVIALTFDDRAAVVDLATGLCKGKMLTGIAPFGVAVSADSSHAYVSNWGGRAPRAGDLAAPTGYDNRKGRSHREQADRVVVDERGIAASGTVTCIDPLSMTILAEIPVGLHPTSLALDEPHGRLYVANSNSDTISVIDTGSNRVVDTISLQPFSTPVAGISPESLVISRDGKQLYAACAGINAVAVVDLDGPAGRRIRGLIPTGWYPCHIALSPDGNYLAIATLLGVGAGSDSAEVARHIKEDDLHTSPGVRRRSVFAYRGTIQVLQIPGALQLPDYSAAVAEDNHLRLRTERCADGGLTVRRPVDPAPIPRKPGEPSPIQHIVYIIKENRTYDQIFGGLGKGNGDPILQHWGEDVAPNHRAIARQFVLLDNFYATGTSSANGHQWATQAQETDYTLLRGYAGRSYPFDGSDPLAYARSGFIWNAVVAAHRSFQDFGEFAGLNGFGIKDRAKFIAEYQKGADFRGLFHTVAPIASLNRHLAADYPSYGLGVPDVVRARIFLRHLKEWERCAEMPDLVMLHLPSDHTGGTWPGFSTPAACIADNDLALGQIVEGLSHSRFWPSLLILVVEDDAQDGIDHVDGHRTIALAASPYIRMGTVDSTFYSHPSMLKTIELVLGLPNLSVFDLVANDMRNCFQEKADFTPYTAIVPRQTLNELNPDASALAGRARAAALASARMNFIIPDAAPEAELNAILWHDAKGWATALPLPVHAAFTPHLVARDDGGKDDD